MKSWYGLYSVAPFYLLGAVIVWKPETYLIHHLLDLQALDA